MHLSVPIHTERKQKKDYIDLYLYWLTNISETDLSTHSIRIPNLMAILCYAEHVHISQTWTQIPTHYFCTGQESRVWVCLRQCNWAIPFHQTSAVMLVLTLENGFRSHSKASTLVSILRLTLGLNRAQDVTIQIVDPPTFLDPLKDQVFNLRRDSKLECRVNGIPYPTVTFKKDWRMIADSHRIKVRIRK